MSVKEDFMKNLSSVMTNDLYDPEAVWNCINHLYDVFDEMIHALVPGDIDAIEDAIAQIIAFQLPVHNVDELADLIKQQFNRYEVENEER